MSRPREDKIRKITARNLTRLLDQKGWTQSDLARRATDYMIGGGRIRPNQVSQWLRGDHAPAKPAAVAVAKALGVGIQEISSHYTDPADDLAVDEELARLHVATIGGGLVRLTVNTQLPFEIAMEIAVKIRKHEVLPNDRSDKSGETNGRDKADDPSVGE